MNKIIKITALTLFAVAFVSCGWEKTSKTEENSEQKIETVETQDTTNSQIIDWNTATIKDLIYLLDKSIDSLPDIKRYKKKKISIEGDEGAMYEWFGIEYKYQNKLIFIAESSWVNKNIVHRVTLYSDRIKDGKLYVGQTFGNIRNLIKNKVPTSPDGYLFVTLDKHPEITIELDISNIPNTSPLYYGGVNISEIPDSLKIESIVVMKK